MNPKTQYNQKEDAPKSQGKDLKRDNIETQEDKMPYDMSLNMEFKKIYKNSRDTSPKRKIRNFGDQRQEVLILMSKQVTLMKRNLHKKTLTLEMMITLLLKKIQVMKKKTLIL